MMPTTPQPLQPIDVIKAKIAVLNATLVSKVPEHKKILVEIHKAVHNDEQLVYLISPEEIGKITACLMEIAQTKILEQKVKAATKKKGTAMSLDI